MLKSIQIKGWRGKEDNEWVMATKTFLEQI